MRLQTKLLIYLVSMAFLVGGLIIFLSHRSVHAILVEEVAKRGLLKAKDLPAEAVSGLQTQSEAAILPILQASLEQTGAVYAVAIDPKGRVLAHTNVVEKGKIYADSATQEALRSDQPGYRELKANGQTVVDVSLPVWSTRQATTEEEFLLFGGKELKETTRLGTLRLGLPFHETLPTEQRITTQIVWILIMTGMIGLGTSLIFTKKILRRVRLLIEGTEKISRGEYGALVPVLSKDELGVLAQSFNQMSDDLAQAHGHLENEVKLRTQELESVIYTMSHDLKSPVVSMQGMASILIEDYSDQFDEKGKHYIQRIIANANYMEEMILDLLALSRVGRPQQSPEPIEVRSVLERILDIHRERFEEKGIEVVIQPTLPHFLFDRVQSTEVFQNLITNAAKFMGDQPHPRIEIGGRESGEWVEYYVKDNGIGIDPEYYDKIFGVFQRLKDVEVEGTGVGLSIVKKIVDLAHGKLWIESRRGEGATFFVRFPKKEEIEG
jgi:signal transduction histidine kinase